jgi:hypothetical protein
MIELALWIVAIYFGGSIVLGLVWGLGSFLCELVKAGR